MPSLLRCWDLLCVVYCVLHIPTTLLIDSQSLFSPSLFPSWAKDVLQWHIKTNGDHLVRDNPTWFLSLVSCELVLQLPVFFILAYGLLYNKAWARIPSIIYGTHVATTLIPILSDFTISSAPGNPKYNLVAIYAPYLLIPLGMVLRMSLAPFPLKLKKSANRKAGKAL